MKNPAHKSRPATAEPSGGGLAIRPRRLRRTESLRALVRETRISPDDFIYPMFVAAGNGAREALTTLPGLFRESEATFAAALRDAAEAGLRAVMLFGIPDRKDAFGSDALRTDGLLARMVRRAKETCPDMTVIADVCFCEYTDHGHCGVLSADGDVDNDATLVNLGLQAVIAAEAGADMIAPSGMMDGTIASLRAVLDAHGFSHVPLMAYSTKFASGFYGPFRDAAGCALDAKSVRGNRKTYQMDPANSREAIRESLLDEAQGADMLMVKPGLPYLDILSQLRQETRLPLAIYQVSGEYAMIKFAALAGALDEDAAVMESLMAFKRAGADLILTYFAPQAARLLASA